ncbi:MAG: type VI secretion protein, partial [Alteraurantiacibacter sp.]
MKLAMRHPEKNLVGANDTDPRDTEDTEIIDLASRTSYPAVANRRNKNDALGLMAGIAFVGLLGAATLWGLNAGGSANEDGDAADAVAVANPNPNTAMPVAISPTEGLPSANASSVMAPQPDPAPMPILSRSPDAVVSAGPVANPYNSPTLVFDGGVAPASAASVAATAEAATAAED